LFQLSAIPSWASTSRLHKIARQQEKRPLLRFDPFEDFEKFADTMLATKRMGILTVAAASLAIGRNNSAFTRNCWRGAATENSA